jgi:hypothetical protein
MCRVQHIRLAEMMISFPIGMKAVLSGERKMPEYVLYCFAGNKLERCDRFNASDDAEAIEEAVRRHDGKAAELWTGARKVDAFEASDACGASFGSAAPRAPTRAEASPADR